MTLLYLVAAWVAGIFLISTGNDTSSELWIGLFAGSVLLAYLVRHSRPWRIGFLCLALFALGAGRYAWATRPYPAHHIAHYADSGYVTLTGILDQDADVRENHVNLRIRVETIEQDSKSHPEPQPTEGLILVQAPRYGDYQYGDRVLVSGSLLTPPEFDDFSYRDYLARRGIHAMIPNARVTLIEHDQGKPWYALMYDLKARAQTTINRLLPSPQAPLLSGILLGTESAISADVRDDFNRTGTTHVIAISGANMIVVIGVLIRLLTPAFGKNKAGWLALLGVSIYTLFVGADPAVVRAALMGGLVLVAGQTGRRAHGLTSLAFAIFLMTAWNPLTLWDVGFQLSVAATAGLILFSQRFENFFKRTLERLFAQETTRQITGWLSEPIIVSLAAQITTTPLMLVYFGRFSIISLLVNILIVPAQAYIMTLGWLAVFLGMIWTPLGQPLAWVVWIPLSYTLEIVRSLGGVEWASTTFTLDPSYAWGIYGGLLVIALWTITHPEDRAVLLGQLRQRITAVAVIITGVILIILVSVIAMQQPDGKLHVWFPDIGHGHAVILQTPNGAQILIDGGPNPTQLRRAVGDILPFGDRDLDLLIVTQPRSDTTSAIPELLEHYDVQLALTNGHTDGNEHAQNLANALAKHNIDVQTVTAGYTIATGDGVLLEILHPQIAPEDDDDTTEVGMVIRVSYGDTSFLLTPDLSADAEQTMLDAGWYIGSTVLELPSRGSEKANPAFFIDAAQPQIAVVSVGTGNRTGLPAPEVSERLQNTITEPLYRTDQHGTVEMVTDGHTLWVYTEN